MAGVMASISNKPKNKANLEHLTMTAEFRKPLNDRRCMFREHSTQDLETDRLKTHQMNIHRKICSDVSNPKQFYS